jgi:adenylate cyclase
MVRSGGSWAQRARLASGLVLVAFVATHLLNHALGLVGIALAEHGRILFLAVWRSAPGQVLLLAALAAHVTLGLARLAARRTLRMPAWESLQLVLGLLVPPLVIGHALGTGMAARAHGMTDSYAWFVTQLWPGAFLNQALLVVVAWAHGCIGIHFRFRLEPAWRRVQGGLLLAAIMLPTLALAGFVAMAREAAAWPPGTISAIAAAQGWITPAAREPIHRLGERLELIWLALVAAVLLAQIARALAQRAAEGIRIGYPGGRTVKIAPGTSVLEASRAHGIAHAAVCGGRGRCSTCRVRVGAGAALLPEPSATEARVLARIKAPADVRLACQLRPRADLVVTPLLPPGTGAAASLTAMDPHQGVEREIAVLFADLRGFTQIAEARLPFDVVFILNRWFAAMGEAIEAEGGHLDKFLGDGLIALFGVEGAVEDAAVRAVAAARRMHMALERLNDDLASELAAPLRQGIGIHAGAAIVGDMGWGRAVALTAIGDTVNVASRLEALTKELGVPLVVSQRTAELARFRAAEAQVVETEIRGRAGRLRVLAVPEAALRSAA